MKTELDKRVAMHLGKSIDDVSDITFEFIEVLRRALVEGGEVVLPRLGALRVRETRVNREVKLTDGPFKPQNAGRTRKLYVHRNLKVFFSKSAHLKAELEKRREKM